MTSTAWKSLERRVCRALGSQRRPSVGRYGWSLGSDDDGSCYFAVEVKYAKRMQLRSPWLAQARRNAKADGRPWLLAIGTHNSPRIVAVLDFYELVALAKDAGRIHTPANEHEGEHMTTEPTTPEPPTDPPPEEPTPGDDDGDTEEA